MIYLRANQIDDLQQRQDYVKGLLEGIKKALEVNCYNPITKKSVTSFNVITTSEVNQFTPFIDALKCASGSIRVAPVTKRDIDAVIDNVSNAAALLGYQWLNIGSIERKHLRRIFDECAKLKDTGEFSAYKFNRHRTYMGILYNELIELDAVVANIPLAVKAKKKAQAEKVELLTPEERKALIEYLTEKSPRFLLFIQCFFHSGARITEMLRVKVKDIDFDRQYITYYVQKGTKYQYKERPLKDIAVPYWREAIKGAHKSDYVWSTGLMPGTTATAPNVIRLRWQRLQPILNIRKGIYSLKHLNTTQTSDLLGAEVAAIQNAESVDMIAKHYDVTYQQRKDDSLKKLNNPL